MLPAVQEKNIGFAQKNFAGECTELEETCRIVAVAVMKLVQDNAAYYLVVEVLINDLVSPTEAFLLLHARSAAHLATKYVPAHPQIHGTLFLVVVQNYTVHVDYNCLVHIRHFLYYVGV